MSDGCQRRLAEQQRLQHHAKADEADHESDRPHHRHAKAVERKINNARSKPYPPAKSGPRIRAIRKNDTQQSHNRDREGFLEIRLSAGEPSGDGIERRKCLVASAYVPVSAVLLRLEVNRGENVNQEQKRSKRGDLEFDWHSRLLFNGTRTVSFASAAIFG